MHFASKTGLDLVLPSRAALQVFGHRPALLSVGSKYTVKISEMRTTINTGLVHAVT